MTPERWAHIRQIFDGALERPEVDRAAYLRVTCAGDDEARKEVESLLTSHRESTQFLDKPAVDLSHSLIQSLQNLSSTSTFATTSGIYTGEYPAGYRIGPYQLQKCIGHGGMGSVWLASRFDHDFNQNVAVKLVKRGMDSQEILRRFRLERQVLAGLQHPNIAALIDGGSTPEGLPYLVMEYVQGVRIDHYCEDHQSSISDRLKLFRQLCAAVQYAHSNLVVHRDIKAGNILVTTDGVPKLLDFGIVKLLHSEFSTLAAAETRPELRPMTLDYASPEQVRGEAISTASDTYSMGVLLYRLLTGKTPYRVDSRNTTALQKAICEQDPIRPSAVILSDEQAIVPQATQKMEVGTETRLKARNRLRKKLSGDLDMIVLMALRKEPDRRYASVEQFSEDIRRYMDGRPVIARSDTFGYRAAKFTRRNAGMVIAATLVGLIMIVALVVSERAASSESQKRALAETRLSSVEAQAIQQERGLMDAYFSLAELQPPAMALKTYQKALKAAQDFAGQFPGKRPTYGLAQAAVKVGDLDPAQSLDRYKEADTELDAYPDSAGVSYGEVSRKLGSAQFKTGDVLAALATFSSGLTWAEKTTAEKSASPGELAASNLCVGETLAYNGQPEAAIGNLRKALELYRSQTGSSVASAGTSVESFEAALGRVASDAPDAVGQEIEAALTEFRRSGK